MINLIQKKKVEIKTGWEHALLFESSINDEILLKSLPFDKSSDKELALRVANYKSFLKSVAINSNTFFIDNGKKRSMFRVNNGAFNEIKKHESIN